MLTVRARAMVWCVAAALVLAGASGAFAQGRGGRGFGGPGGGFGGKVNLVGMEQVQKELKISDEQKTKLDEVAKAYRDESRKLIPEGTAREDFAKKIEETKPQREKLQADAEKKIDEVLAIDQKERLDEITLQLAGAFGLTQDKIATKLGVTEEQKTKIKAVLDEQRKKAEEEREKRRSEGGGNNQRPDFNALRERFQAQQKETTEKATAILTAEQKANWEKMKGEKFELQFGNFGGQGGQRRRPQN